MHPLAAVEEDYINPARPPLWAGMTAYTGPTSTHPCPSRCPSISGAMYAGVPRGCAVTVPQPRPVGRGMARRASPKSLILADTDRDPSGLTLETHSTCQVSGGGVGGGAQAAHVLEKATPKVHMGSLWRQGGWGGVAQTVQHEQMSSYCKLESRTA